MEINDKLVSYVAELAHLKLDDEPRVSGGQRIPRGRSEAQHGARTDFEKRAEAERGLLPRSQNGGVRRAKHEFI